MITTPRWGRAAPAFRAGSAAGLVFVAMLSSGIVPGAAEAQVPNSGSRNVTIGFQPGSASQNGYMDAQLQLKYWIAACSSGPSLLMQAPPTPHMLVGPHRYWVDGRQVQVPPHIAAPKLSDPPTVRGTVRGRGINKDVTYVYTTTAPNAPDCWFNDAPVANAADMWKKGATDEEKAAVLREIAFHPTGQFAPLRNPEVEEHFRAIWKKERSDSIARVQAQREEERKKAAAAAAEKERLAKLEREQKAEADRKAAAQRAAAQQSAAAQQPSSQGGTQQSPQGQAQSSRQVQAPIAIPGATTPYVRDTGGRFYQRQPDGRYAQISEAEYNSGQAREREAKLEAHRKAEAEKQAQLEKARLAEEQRKAEMETERIRARGEAGQLAGAIVQDAISSGSRIGLTYSMVVPRSGKDISTIGLMYNTGDDFTYFNLALGTDLLGYMLAEEGTNPELSSDANMAFMAGMLVGVTPLGLVVDNWGLMPVVEAGIVTGADPEEEEIGFMDMFYGGAGLVMRMGGLDLIATLSPFTSTMNSTLGVTLQF